MHAMQIPMKGTWNLQNQDCLYIVQQWNSQTHRRLAAEYIAEQIPDIEIVHL